jgi:hypothetical protein
MQDATEAASYSFSRNQLDKVRQAICALSATSKGSLSKPVHFHRVRHLIRYLVDKEALQHALTRMEVLTEAISIGNGFWLPAPVRYVAIGGAYLILAPLTTNLLLKSVNPPISEVGSARVSSTRPVGLSEQGYWSWTGAPEDTMGWAAALLESAKKSLNPTSIDPSTVDVHAFSPETVAAPKRPGMWKLLQKMGEFSGLALSRVRLSATAYRYLIAQISDGVLTHESPVRHGDRARLRYALDAMNGRRHSIAIRQHGDRYHFELYRPIPFEEMRAIHALAWCEERGAGTTVEFACSHLNSLRQVLSPLGITLEVIQ